MKLLTVGEIRLLRKYTDIEMGIKYLQMIEKNYYKYRCLLLLGILERLACLI